MNTRQLAQRLRLSPPAAVRLIRQGLIRATLISGAKEGGNRYLITEEDFDQFLVDRTEKVKN